MWEVHSLLPDAAVYAGLVTAHGTGLHFLAASSNCTMAGRRTDRTRAGAAFKCVSRACVTGLCHGHVSRPCVTGLDLGLCGVGTCSVCGVWVCVCA